MGEYTTSSRNTLGDEQYGAVESAIPGFARASANSATRQSSNREVNDLLGVASQFTDTGHTQFLSPSIQAAISQQRLPCPYHVSILQGRATEIHAGQDLPMIDRYLAEGSSETSALLYRPDTGELSTYKGCSCYEIMQSSMNAGN
jgi:hypothetical protein